jgi:hypothetical protein
LPSASSRLDLDLERFTFCVALRIKVPLGTLTFQDTEINPEAKKLSGVMAALAKVQSEVIHLTRSAIANLDQIKMTPPKIISFAEDCRCSRDDLLFELRSVRKQLLIKHQALNQTISQLCAANAHCTSLHRELGNAREQLDNLRKKKERGSNKIKSRFLTSRDNQEAFDKEDAEQIKCEHVMAEK